MASAVRDGLEAEMQRILRDGEMEGELYSDIVESLLDVIFRQEVEWFAEKKAKRAPTLPHRR